MGRYLSGYWLEAGLMNGNIQEIIIVTAFLIGGLFILRQALGA